MNDSQPLSWKDDDNTYRIEDDLGREMWYRLNPSKQSEPSNSPIMMILHGHGSTNYLSNYSEEKWNILIPIDNFGLEQKGSWWLGESGDLSTSNLLEIVLNDARLRLGSNEDVNLFIWGSSMGGYGAIIHGMLFRASGVYANVPQIKLLGTTYSERGMKKYFEYVIGNPIENIHNNLCDFVSNWNASHPLYFICENRFGQENYLEQQAMTFISCLNELDVNYHLEIMPTSGHGKNRGIKEARALFEEFCEPHGSDSNE